MERVELIAKALFENRERRALRAPSTSGPVRWEGLHPRIKADHMSDAVAAIEAMEGVASQCKGKA